MLVNTIVKAKCSSKQNCRASKHHGGSQNEAFKCMGSNMSQASQVLGCFVYDTELHLQVEKLYANAILPVCKDKVPLISSTDQQLVSTLGTISNA